jgi:hypothetical protein
LHEELIEDWIFLKKLLEEVHLDFTNRDAVSFSIDKSHMFTTKSLHQVLTHGGVRDHLCSLIWKSKNPVKVFL